MWGPFVAKKWGTSASFFLEAQKRFQEMRRQNFFWGPKLGVLGGQNVYVEKVYVLFPSLTKVYVEKVYVRSLSIVEPSMKFSACKFLGC